MIRPFFWLSALLSLAILSPLVVRANPGESPRGSIDRPDSSERYRPDPIQWRPCDENATLECGTLTLPVDYREPRGKTFELAVIRARATNLGQRTGVLMVNPGGPGFSGIDFVLQGVAFDAPILTRLRERFDIVSFDPRGAARSQPVRCELPAAGRPTDHDPASLARFFDDFSRRLAEACREQNGTFILTMSTNTIARDMDVLRRALGEAQVSYLGASFGTELGAVYASLFPRRCPWWTSAPAARSPPSASRPTAAASPTCWRPTPASG